MKKIITIIVSLMLIVATSPICAEKNNEKIYLEFDYYVVEIERDPSNYSIEKIVDDNVTTYYLTNIETGEIDSYKDEPILVDTKSAGSYYTRVFKA